MDYYEELGIPAQAGIDDIRRAYRRLARQYHPDTQTVPERRRAEARMRRLNEIVEILSDTKARSRYDISLREAAMREAQRVYQQHLFESRVRRNRVWLAMIAVCAVAAISFVGFEYWDRPEPVASRPVELSQLVQHPIRAAFQKPPEVPPEPVQNPSPAPAADSGPAIKPPPALPIAMIAIETDEPPRVASDIPLPPAPAKLDVSIDSKPIAPQPTVSGTWVYTPSTSVRSNLPFSADYVEVTVNVTDRKVSGKFHGRFDVRNSTLPPTVVFGFQGSDLDLSNGLAWRSDNGAEGTCKLRLLSPTAMEFAWFTTRPAPYPSLTSGSAVLARYSSEE